MKLKFSLAINEAQARMPMCKENITNFDLGKSIFLIFFLIMFLKTRFLTIHGTNGNSGERKLERSKECFNKFERNQIDTFEINAKDLGQLLKINIRLFGYAYSSEWYLENVKIIDPIKEQMCLFNCQNWLKPNMEDNNASCELLQTLISN